jgi:hypothetical protein
MSAKHLLRAALAGAVLLGVSLYDAKPTHGQPAHISCMQFYGSSVDRTDVPWQTSAVED